MEAPDLLHPPAPALPAAIPDLVYAVLGDSHNGGDGGSTLQRWSSIIGIITAICGNILISFALNVQRYAHIRLRRESMRDARRSQIGKRTIGGGTVYGAADDTGAKRNVARVNGSPGENTGKQIQSISEVSTGNMDGDSDDGATEREPLTQSFISARSCNSNSTIRGSNYTAESLLIPPKTYLRSPYWWSGIILMTIGEAGNFLAYGFASASTVSPLGVVALVSNCVIAPLMLKEPFRIRDFWGVVVAITGAVVVVLSAKHSETKLGPHEIWWAIARWEFETYVGITVTLILLGMWSSKKYGERIILIDLGLVALFGGYTALSTKGVASLLSYKFFHMVTFPVTYLLIAVLVSTALLQIKYLNRALQRFDSTQVIPTQFVLFTLSVIIGSTVLYRDFEKATSDRVIKFVAGCMLTFTGVYLITSNRPRSQDYDEEFEADEEAAIGLVGREEECPGGVDGFPVDDIWDRRKPVQDAELDRDMSEEEGEEEDEEEISPSRRGPYNGGDSVYSLPRQLNSQSSRSSIPSEVSSLLENPWQASGMEQPLAAPPKSRPRLHGSSSGSPSVSGKRTPRDQGLPEVSLTRSSSQPLQTDAHTTPAASAPRNSLSLMMPGPLSSPLSSLTAVVADELRRGVDNVPSPSRKRHGSLRVSRLSSQPSARKVKSPHDVGQGDAVGREGRASRPQQTPSPVVAKDPGPVNTGKGRARKLGAALGDLVKWNKVKNATVEREQSESGEENGR